MKTSHKAALLDMSDKVIGLVYDAPEKGNKIKIAGTFTIDGTPVNVKTYRISRDQRNLRLAEYEEPISLHGSGVYTW